MVNDLVARARTDKDVGAMVTLAQIFENGFMTISVDDKAARVPVPKNYTTALNWYRELAAVDSPAKGAALFAIGQFYEIGLGTASDINAAFDAFTRSAAEEYAPAQYKLAQYYFSGVAVSQDNTRGISFLNKSAVNVKGKNSEAANELGMIFLQGQAGQKQNSETALKWLLYAASLGNRNAIMNLAAIYLEGAGEIKVDATQALKWLLVMQESGISHDTLKKQIAELKGKAGAAQSEKMLQEAKTFLENLKSRIEKEAKERAASQETASAKK
jgi:TPR repeat protein